MKSAIIILSVFYAGCCGGEKSPDAEVNRWLDLEIERPDVGLRVIFEDYYGEPDENGLITNTYRVHPAGVSVPMVPEIDEPGAAPDPFAAPAGSETDFTIRVPRKIDPRGALESYGVEFGPGSDATFDRESKALRVTQTPDQMDLVEAVIRGGGCSEGSVIFRVEIFEISAVDALQLEQSAGGYFEHSAERSAVLDLVRSEAARIVTTVNLWTRSGQRTNYKDSREIRFVGGFKWEGEGESENRTLVPEMKTMQVGTIVEVDSVLGPANEFIDLRIAIDHQLGPLVWRSVESSVPGMDGPAVIESPQVSKGSIRVNETTRSGQIKLLCSWEIPADGQKEPQRRIVFFKATSAKYLP